MISETREQMADRLEERAEYQSKRADNINPACCPDCADKLPMRRAYAAALRAGAQALRETPQWQSIETAPKDDTAILTFRGAGLMAVAAYFPHGEAEWCATDGCHLLNVTHWMPLPSAPAPSEDEK